jgi:hypothetical protein
MTETTNKVGTMNEVERNATVSHNVRLEIAVRENYDDFRRRFESSIPRVKFSSSAKTTTSGEQSVSMSDFALAHDEIAGPELIAHAYRVPAIAALRPMVPLSTIARNTDLAFFAF